MKYKVLKDFVNKKGKFFYRGLIYDMNTPEDSNKFYKSLLGYKFIEEVSVCNLDAMRRNTIKSRLANVIIAGEDYAEGTKNHFTWDEAMALEKKLPEGWRLPTRSEWALIAEEFGQKDGELDADALIDNLGVNRNGLVNLGSLSDAGGGGYYWSSTASNASSAYALCFSSGGVNPSSTNLRYFGFSVRLVKDLETKE